MMKRIISIALLAAMLGTNAYAYSGASSWAESTLEKAANASIVPDGILDANVSSMIKKGECASLCVKFCERMSGKSAETAQNPFSDNVSEDVLKAVSLGIVGTYGGAGFNENSFASREEIADMLAKTYASVSGEKAQISDKVLFADDINISDWARESVYFVQSKNIIHIVGSNKFAPKNLTEDQTRANYANMSVQNVLISLVKMYDMLGGTESGKTDGKVTVAEYCLSLMPDIDFGTKEEPVLKDDMASVTVKDVTQTDYFNYVEKTKTNFPEEMYSLDGQNYKAWDGTYSINLVYQNSILTVEVFKY